MYMYIFDGTGFTINTGPPIKQEVLEQTPKRCVTLFTYENGLTLRVEQEAKRFVVYSNRPLNQNPDGSYS